MNLTGHTILITGGSRGIGLELARQLLEKKNTVIITGRNQETLAKVKKAHPQLLIFNSDVASDKDIETLRDAVTSQFPNLNILINNAGIMKSLNLQDSRSSLAELTNEIDINLKGPIKMTQMFLPHLKRKSTAAIVNVSSGLAFVPLPISPVYSATKAALHSYTLSLRVQLKNTDIKVFEFAPPATQTDLIGDMQDDMKGISVMDVQEMVSRCLAGMERDNYEIRPGQSNQLKLMSRLAPEFILKQLSRPVERMHRTARN